MSFTVFEHAYYIGNYMSGMLYGVELVMYIETIKQLTSRRTLGSPRTRRFFGAYSTALLILLTIDISTNAVWGEMMWIKGREHVGGVRGWFMDEVSVWYQTLSSTSVVAMIFLGDALLLHRLFIIWGSNYWIMIFPVLAYLAAFALAIIQLVIAGEPGGNFFGHKTLDFGIAYYTITIGLNIIVTLLICLRLLRLSNAIGRVLGKDSAEMYTNVVTILVESAAPYSLVGITFLIPYALNHPISIGFGQVWAKLTCICPQLIVLRVVSGKAWRKDLISEAQSTVMFEHGKSKMTTTTMTTTTTTLEMPARTGTKFTVGSVDDSAVSPQESHGSTFMGSPIEKWHHDANNSSAKLSV